MLLRNYRELPAIDCVQHTAEKVIVTEKAIQKSNLNGMGNKVGTITNRGTSMMEVQSRFEKDSKEWNELQYRIDCVQMFQQEEIDKIKGIVTKPMPASWFNISACDGDEYLKSICADKRPYFMSYARSDYAAKKNKYNKEVEIKCYTDFGETIDELMNEYINGLLDLDNITSEVKRKKEFIRWYLLLQPLGNGKCAMNRICWHIENELDGYKILLKKNNNFDYTKLKVNRRCSSAHREKMVKLFEFYKDEARYFKKKKYSYEQMLDMDSVSKASERHMFENIIRDKAKEICPDDNERLNIVLDMCYSEPNYRAFMWFVVGDLICRRLEEMEGCIED